MTLKFLQGTVEVSFPLDEESENLIDRLIQVSGRTKEHVLRRAMSLFNIDSSLKQDYGNNSYIGVIERDGSCGQEVILANSDVLSDDLFRCAVSLSDQDFILLKKLCGGDVNDELTISSVIKRGLLLYDKLEEVMEQGKEIGIVQNNTFVKRIRLGNPADQSVPADQPVPV
jgi:hypothetical protein